MTAAFEAGYEDGVLEVILPAAAKALEPPKPRTIPIKTALPVKAAKVEVYTGAEDSLLRRLIVNATVDGKPVVVDLTLTQVGADLAIDAPQGARPFSELMQKFQAAGGPDVLQIK